jgi:hypothetical protein
MTNIKAAGKYRQVRHTPNSLALLLCFFGIPGGWPSQEGGFDGVIMCGDGRVTPVWMCGCAGGQDVRGERRRHHPLPGTFDEIRARGRLVAFLWHADLCPLLRFSSLH